MVGVIPETARLRGTQHRGIMGFALLHLLGQGQIIIRLSLGGGVQESGQADGVDVTGHMLCQPGLANAG